LSSFHRGEMSLIPVQCTLRFVVEEEAPRNVVVYVLVFLPRSEPFHQCSIQIIFKLFLSKGQTGKDWSFRKWVVLDRT